MDAFLLQDDDGKPFSCAMPERYVRRKCRPIALGNPLGDGSFHTAVHRDGGVEEVEVVADDRDSDPTNDARPDGC